MLTPTRDLWDRLSPSWAGRIGIEGPGQEAEVKSYTATFLLECVKCLCARRELFNPLGTIRRREAERKTPLNQRPQTHVPSCTSEEALPAPPPLPPPAGGNQVRSQGLVKNSLFVLPRKWLFFQSCVPASLSNAPCAFEATTCPIHPGGRLVCPFIKVRFEA